MSIQYQKEIFSNRKLKLMVNFSGIKKDVADATSLRLEIYAFEITGKPIFSETLNVNQTRSLYNHLNQVSIIKDKAKKKTEKFIEATDEIIKLTKKLEKIDTSLLKVFFEKLNSDEKIKSVLESLSEIELESLEATIKQTSHKKALKELAQLLKIEGKENIVKEIKKYPNLLKYQAKQPEKIFQNWIEKNLWVFGVEYIKKHNARKIALFSESDLLMESMDGFLDLIELKRPKLKYKIFNYDATHKSYYPSSDLSKVIGQCLFDLQKMDEYKTILEKEYKVKVLKPRIKIIAGRTKAFNEKQFEALKMLNSNLNHIQIISYDYLLSCGNTIISYYECK